MKRIMIVDEDQALLDAPNMILQYEDYEVETLNSGLNLIEHVLKWKPDVILLEIALGLLDGQDLCNELKATDGSLHIPVILFSALHGKIVTEDLRDSPDDFIAKPSDVRDLKERILAQL
ncbi:PleD family two-component system response regulator [Pedobacter jeongneungensis]|uniref:response regulator n=1 Tax=Pedobacter jeongneungensis TaxID=947309 RepID=UPI00046915BC|nr:response regulator [Pedobacter jeongneungensis]